MQLAYPTALLKKVFGLQFLGYILDYFRVPLKTQVRSGFFKAGFVEKHGLDWVLKISHKYPL